MIEWQIRKLLTAPAVYPYVYSLQTHMAFTYAVMGLGLVSVALIAYRFRHRWLGPLRTLLRRWLGANSAFYILLVILVLLLIVATIIDLKEPGWSVALVLEEMFETNAAITLMLACASLYDSDASKLRGTRTVSDGVAANPSSVEQ